MSNKIKDILKNFDPNIKINEKLYKNILIYYIGYLTVQNQKYVKINSKNPLYLIIENMNGYFEKINKNKYLILVPTYESKEKIKKYEELWSTIRDVIRSITKNSADYDEKYMKIKYNFDDTLPLNKMIEISRMIIVVRAVFHENNKYYPQVFLDECLYKL